MLTPACKASSCMGIHMMTCTGGKLLLFIYNFNIILNGFPWKFPDYIRLRIYSFRRLFNDAISTGTLLRQQHM
jgi:hypothetical protein